MSDRFLRTDPSPSEHNNQGLHHELQLSMTTALFMLRCVELGLNIADLDLLTIGSVNDMFNEKSRDSMEWREEASQGDMDKF